jgi:hypothetical protein
MVDCVCLVVKEFGEGEEFGKGGFDDVEEFFAGDTVDRGSGTKNVIFSNRPNFIPEFSNLL